MSSFPDQFTCQSGLLERYDPKEISQWDRDPRGIVWCWEPPLSGALYVMGIDPSFGITNWNRSARTQEDRKTNNGVIEVLRVGINGQPDRQVCEYAAPIDATELGALACLLGRVYHGQEEDGCKCIIEVFPGPGSLTLQEMIGRGYANFWHWEFYGNTAAQGTSAMGWNASPKTLRDLWAKSARHLNKQQAIVKSPWLAEEYADARWVAEKFYAENPNNDKGHGDRVRAFNLAIWAANGWSLSSERNPEPVKTTPKVQDYQASDMSWGEIQESWGELLDRI